MYHLLLTSALDEDTQYESPQAIDAQLCIRLASERDSPKLIAPLPFTVGQASLHRDYLPIGNVPGKLCSQSFLNLLQEASVPFTAYTAHLIEKDTEQELAARYFYWIPQWIEDAIDGERSEHWGNVETGVRRLTKLVLTEETTIRAPLLFQTRERGYYLIHERLKTQLEAASMVGVAFAPLDAVNLPEVGMKKSSLERVLAEHSDDVKSWYELSHIYTLLCRYQDACTALKQAIILDPDWDEARFKQGIILYTLGQLQNAADSLWRAIEINPQSKAWIEYCAVLRDLGQYWDALRSAEKATQIWNKTSLSWYELAATHLAMQHYEEALQAIEQGLRRGRGGGPHFAAMYRLKGEALFHLGQLNEALDAYTTGLLYRPLDRALWAGKANILRNLGRGDEAAIAQRELDRLEQQREKNLQKNQHSKVSRLLDKIDLRYSLW